MVQRQAQKWPYSDVRRRFTSKTNMDRMRGVLLNRAFGFTKEVEVVLPLSPSPSPPPPPAAAAAPPPPPCGSQAGPQQDVEAREPDEEEEEPARDLGSGRASPGVQPEGDQCGAEPDDYAHESVEVNLYVTFVSPGAEAERNVYTVEVPRVGWVDVLTREWEVDTEQLIDRLAMRAPRVAGGCACAVRVGPCRVAHTDFPKTRCHGDLVP